MDYPPTEVAVCVETEKRLELPVWNFFSRLILREMQFFCSLILIRFPV